MSKSRLSAKKLALTAVLMAMNIIMSMSIFSIPVPGGHMYLNDLIICTAAILLDPFCAFMVGGVGAFIGDMLFYPAPMFVSLVSHGLQAVIISVCTRRLIKDKPAPSSVIGAVFGLIVSVVGYSLGRAFVYSTPEYAIMKLPFQCLQAGVGAVTSWILCCPLGLTRRFRSIVK